MAICLTGTPMIDIQKRHILMHTVCCVTRSSQASLHFARGCPICRKVMYQMQRRKEIGLMKNEQNRVDFVDIAE